MTSDWLLSLLLWLASLTGVSDATPTPVPEPAVVTYEAPADVRAVVCAADYAWTCEEALAIVWCESRNDPWATGDLGEVGWFQIHPIHGLGSSGYDPYVNTAYAYELWLAEGWSPWTCA